jgi:hypothetical protein
MWHQSRTVQVGWRQIASQLSPISNLQLNNVCQKEGWIASKAVQSILHLHS